jgi:hypothetical protein
MLPPPREERREERDGRREAGAGLRRVISRCTWIVLSSFSLQEIFTYIKQEGDGKLLTAISRIWKIYINVKNIEIYKFSLYVQ